MTTEEQVNANLDRLGDEIKNLRQPREMPQVYVSVSGGIAEVMVQRGEVDVVHIDWDNVTPDNRDPADAVRAMETAIDDSMRLPGPSAQQNLLDMQQWLDDNILSYPANEAWEQAHELDGLIRKHLAGIRDQVDYVSHTSEEE
jgi:hypothetical protein